MFERVIDMKKFNKLIKDRMIEIGKGTSEERMLHHTELHFWTELKSVAMTICNHDDENKELKVLKTLTSQLTEFKNMN